MKKSIFQRHPSKLLNELYSKKNYQGANPKDAKILFIGRDPNWAADVDSKEMFNYVSEYLNDGVSFWETHNIHHPFLLANYKGDGKRYHTMFSKLKVESNFANKISFIELIGFPTTGMAKSNNKDFKKDLVSDPNSNHLIELNNLINDQSKIIFIAWGLIGDFKFLYDKTGMFQKFAQLDKREMNINDLNQFENIFIHKHFSDSISNDTIGKMAEKVRQYLTQ
jgi:hypothetical protein